MVQYTLLALLLSHACVSFHFCILGWKVSVALVLNSVTWLTAPVAKDCLRCADLVKHTHILHSTALSSCSHPDKFAKQSCWNSCFSCWAQLSGRTWTLHVGWGITKRQERSSGPALLGPHSQGLTNRYISLLLPAKFGLQFCLNARDVFSHISVLRTEQTQLVSALVEGVLIMGTGDP